MVSEACTRLHTGSQVSVIETLPMDQVLHRASKTIGPSGILDEVDLPLIIIIDPGGIQWGW